MATGTRHDKDIENLDSPFEFDQEKENIQAESHVTFGNLDETNLNDLLDQEKTKIFKNLEYKNYFYETPMKSPTKT
jgi:hypothetical protein